MAKVSIWCPGVGKSVPLLGATKTGAFPTRGLSFSPSDGHLEEALGQELWSEIVGTF